MDTQRRRALKHMVRERGTGRPVSWYFWALDRLGVRDVRRLAVLRVAIAFGPGAA